MKKLLLKIKNIFKDEQNIEMKPKIEIGEMLFNVVCSQSKNYEINQKGTWDLDKSTWDIKKKP